MTSVGDCRPASSWKLRTRTLAVGRIPLLMGILNVTPDSFSDGGRFFDPGRAVEHGLRSGRRRGRPAGRRRREHPPRLRAGRCRRRTPPRAAGDRGPRPAKPTCRFRSIPTGRSWPARPLAAGAETINDVTALSGRRGHAGPGGRSGCGVCAMHMRGTPRDHAAKPVYQDVVGEVFDYLRRRRDALLAAGVEQARIALDPGIGFGKTTAHNLALLDAHRAVPRLGLSAVGGPVAEAIHRRSAGRFRGGPHWPAPSAWPWPWLGRACRSSASTTWRRCGRRCCCFRRAADAR